MGLLLMNVRPVGEADNSLSFCTEVKNDWSHNSTPPSPHAVQATDESYVSRAVLYSVQHYHPPSPFNFEFLYSFPWRPR